jgi:hypothetical protein
MMTPIAKAILTECGGIILAPNIYNHLLVNLHIFSKAPHLQIRKESTVFQGVATPDSRWPSTATACGRFNPKFSTLVHNIIY